MIEGFELACWIVGGLFSLVVLCFGAAHTYGLYYYSFGRSFMKELKRSCRDCRPRLSLGVLLFEESGFRLDFFGFLIPLFFLDPWYRFPEDMVERWGFYFIDRMIAFSWGGKTRHFSLPWDFKHMKTEVLRPDGTWVPKVYSYERHKEPDGRWTETYPYTYRLKNGEIQERQATVYVDRMEWRWRCCTWLPWLALVRKSIEVEFDQEVGERTGSWKGGTVGCSYEMRPGETPNQTLRRMEREREFN